MPTPITVGVRRRAIRASLSFAAAIARALQHPPAHDRSARTIKELVGTCRRRMTPTEKIDRRSMRSVFGKAGFRVSFDHTNQGRSDMTLTLKWDAIAVCAVFVFVGAVLLGAF
jgi:hypothetical protein